MIDQGPDADDLGGRHALVVDLGTTGLKVGLASLAGEMRWAGACDLDTTFLPGGGAEQDPEGWWRLVVDLARQGVASGAVDPATIEAVGVTGEWSSVVPVAEDGAPVGPCVLWMDTRGGTGARARVGGPVAGYRPRAIIEWIRRSGGAPDLQGADALGSLWYLHDHEPEVTRAARWFLEPVDHLTMRFSGVAAASPASMTGAWLTDTRRLDRLGYDRRLVRLAGLDVARLPPLRPALSVIGPVRPDVAAELGLPASARVITGLPDLHAAALGSGAVDDLAAHLSIGTTSWVSCHVPRKRTDAIRQVATVPGVRPDRYLVADNHETAGRCLHWLRDVLAPEPGPAARLDFADLDRLAATSPPGSGGVIFTPWLAGIRTPVADLAARGGFAGLSLTTTRADLVRAVLEGVALQNRWVLAAVERFVDARLEPIRLVGGGAASDLWAAIHADVLDRTVEQVTDPLHAGLRGMALAAAIAAGQIRIHQVPDLVPAAATHRPDPATRRVYDHLAADLPARHRSQRRLAARARRRTRHD